MVRADLVVSLKNAIERGYSIEQAKQSLLNSNYSSQDIEEASNYLYSGGSMNSLVPQTQTQHHEQQISTTPQKAEQQPEQNQQMQNPQQPQVKQLPQQNYPPQKKSSNTGLIILLSGILVILIGLIVLGIFFKDSITGFLSKLFG